MGERKIIQKHQHELKKITANTDGKTRQTKEPREEHNGIIQSLCNTLLLHTASCTSQTCVSQNCHKMKKLSLHGETCKKKHVSGCNLCRRIWGLLKFHTSQCKDPKCPVPKCLVFHQRHRQLAMQQQAMDSVFFLQMFSSFLVLRLS